VEIRPTYEELEQNVKALQIEVERLNRIVKNINRNDLDIQQPNNLFTKKSTDNALTKTIPTFWFDRYINSSIVKYDYPIHIYGEPGTCKESLALYIHSKSHRRRSQFITVNCSSVPEDLIEVELFGHIKDPFSDTPHKNKGCFEIAEGGTIFLNDISELSLQMQYKLQRVLEDRIYKLIGSDKAIPVNVGIISASTKRLEDEVGFKRFRPDLFYKLNIIPIDAFPLRERKNEIPILIDYLLLEHSKRCGQKPPKVSGEAMSKLLSHHWPGNVRELENTIQFSIVKCNDIIILSDNLPLGLNKQEEIYLHREAHKKLDYDIVKSILVKTGGNKAKAARLLGVGRATLYRFLDDNPELKKY